MSVPISTMEAHAMVGEDAPRGAKAGVERPPGDEARRARFVMISNSF